MTRLRSKWRPPRGQTKCRRASRSLDRGSAFRRRRACTPRLESRRPRRHREQSDTTVEARGQHRSDGCANVLSSEELSRRSGGWSLSLVCGCGCSRQLLLFLALLLACALLLEFALAVHLAHGGALRLGHTERPLVGCCAALARRSPGWAKPGKRWAKVFSPRLTDEGKRPCIQGLFPFPVAGAGFEPATSGL
jgi:hypothetical protein